MESGLNIVGLIASVCQKIEVTFIQLAMNKPDFRRAGIQFNVRSQLGGERRTQGCFILNKNAARTRPLEEFTGKRPDFRAVAPAFQEAGRKVGNRLGGDHDSAVQGIVSDLLAGGQRDSFDTGQNHCGMGNSGKLDGLIIDEIEIETSVQDAAEDILS